MAFLPIRAYNRRSKVRINKKAVISTATTYVDLSSGAGRRDLAKYSAIGAIYPVGALSGSSSTVVVHSGVTVTAQATPDQTVAVAVGELRNRDTGDYRTTAAVAALAATAAHATLTRLDIVQVNTTTGVVSYKAGTAATTPVAPTPDAGNIVVARTTRAAADNAISAGEITDTRPRA